MICLSCESTNHGDSNVGHLYQIMLFQKHKLDEEKKKPKSRNEAVKSIDRIFVFRYNNLVLFQ